ncbi:electron transport complex subunit RsxG [Colwellia sp. MEBiC06753]
MRIAIEKNAKILALFAIGCTALVGLTYELTKGRIKAQEQSELLSTLHAIVSDDVHDNIMSNHCIIVQDELLGTNEPHKAYLATLAEQPVAAAITTTAPDGYNGKIELIVAVNIDGSIGGVRTLKHQETPGLGDKIETRKSDWIYTFTDRTDSEVQSNRWKVKKDGGMFDQFTGATITPRAVVKAIKNTAHYFEKNKTTLFQQAHNCEV